MHRHHQKPVSSRKARSHRDQFFHLPTVLAENDPVLRRLYSFALFILDDHPYPHTSKQYARRTSEIQAKIQKLNLSPAQLRFLRRLTEKTGVSLVDFWHGSHIVTLDHGQLYHLWSHMPSAVPRFSSHYGQVPLQQYGINFHDHQLLFGKTSVHGHTWFQMEAHAFDPIDIVDDPDNVVFHGQDFLKYRLNRMNVGPFGFSPHTETSNPIILSYRPQGKQHARQQKPSSSTRSAR